MAIPANTSPVRSQRDVRTVRVFTDEWGRKWRVTVNNLGVHAGYPVSPFTPLFTAPIYPPDKFLRITDLAAGEIRTDTEAWLEDRIEAHTTYDLLKHQWATALFGDGAAAAIERGDKALMFRIGHPPLPIEQVQAYEEGHPWVLGLDDEKPESLAPYFPETEAPRKKHFATAAEERGEVRTERAPNNGGRAPRRGGRAAREA